MKCSFCKSECIPYGNGSIRSTTHMYNALCVSCPNPVLQSTQKGEYSILCLHHGYWYEIVNLPETKACLVYQLINDLKVDQERGVETQPLTRKFLHQFDGKEYNINPTNAKDKLLTILTFG